jgi:hypothetical protein
MEKITANRANFRLIFRSPYPYIQYVISRPAIEEPVEFLVEEFLDNVFEAHSLVLDTHFRHSAVYYKPRCTDDFRMFELPEYFSKYICALGTGSFNKKQHTQFIFKYLLPAYFQQERKRLNRYFRRNAFNQFITTQ